MERITSLLILGGIVLILALVPLVYSSHAQESFILPKAALFQLAMAALILPFSVQIIFFPRRAATGREPMKLALVAWAAWIAVTSLLSLDRPESLDKLLYSGCLVLLFFLVARNARSSRRIWLLLTVIAVIGVWESAYGIAQRAGLKMLYEASVGEARPGIMEGGVILLRDTGPSRGSILGTFGNANHLASYLVLTVPLLFGGLGLPGGALRRFAAVLRTALLACIAVSLIYIIVTETMRPIVPGSAGFAFAATPFALSAIGMMLLIAGAGAVAGRRPAGLRVVLLLCLPAAVACAIASPAHLPWITAAACSAAFLLASLQGRWLAFSLRSMILLSLVTTLACLVLTGARAAWIATAVSVCCLVACWFRQDLRRGLTFTVVAVLILACLLALIFFTEPRIARELGERFDKLFSLSGGTQSYRLLTWRLSLRMIESHPLFGSGPGTFRLLFLPALTDYLRERGPLSLWYFSEKMNEPHNEYLQIAVENGIPGLLFFLAIVFLAIRTAWRTAPSGPVFRGATAIPLLAAIAGVLTHAVASIPFSVVPTTVAFWCLLALVFSLRGDTACRTRPPARIGIAARCAIAIALLAFALVLGRSTLNGISFSRRFKSATALNQMGKHAEALPHFRDALALKPHSGQLKFYYGSTLIQLGRDDEGAALLEESRKNFQDIYIHKNLGIAYERMGQPRRALDQYRRWKNMGIASHKANNLIGLLLLKEGRLKEAEDCFRETIGARPWDWTAYVNLGTIQMETGRIEDALATLKPQFLWRIPNAYIMYGIALLKAGHYDRAEESFDHAISLDPRSVKARNNLGALYYTAGRYALAKKTWLEVLTIDPDNAIALKNLETVRGVLRPDGGDEE